MTNLKPGISLVMAVYNNLEVVMKFLEHREPSQVPLVISCLGSDDKTQDFLKEWEGVNKGEVKVVTGSRNKRVTFSENWNAAINAVETEKMVLIHNDFVIGPNFESILNQTLDEEGKNTFIEYTTVEPLIYVGHIRPGKLLGGFGTTFENFNYQEFKDFCLSVQESKKDAKRQPGYGFFLAGWTESFQDVGGFDSDTFTPCFCEDDDLSIRNKMKGYRTVVEPRALVFHFVSLTSRNLQRTPSENEVNVNRKFARKWGFEARYLWETGYERSENPLQLWNWKTSLRVSRNLNPDTVQDIVTNFEPLVDKIILEAPYLYSKHVQDYIEEETPKAGLDIRSKYETDQGQKYDIDFYLTGLPDHTVFPRVVGGFRFVSKLKEGEYSPYPWLKVVINSKVCQELRQDTKNYLSLQKNKDWSAK